MPGAEVAGTAAGWGLPVRGGVPPGQREPRSMQGGASAYSAASALVSAVVASGLPDGVAALRSLDVWTAVAVLSPAPLLQGGRV